MSKFIINNFLHWEIINEKNSNILQNRFELGIILIAVQCEPFWNESSNAYHMGLLQGLYRVIHMIVLYKLYNVKFWLIGFNKTYTRYFSPYIQFCLQREKVIVESVLKQLEDPCNGPYSVLQCMENTLYFEWKKPGFEFCLYHLPSLLIRQIIAYSLSIFNSFLINIIGAIHAFFRVLERLNEIMYMKIDKVNLFAHTHQV